ncbi:hypothetical protein PRIPAC_70488 [Pristionchus pacificus]|uniref:Arrestin_C domain-containing protein n=1 Tax=Pristionchus pacificus TaxID=54126 RepID=A0A2A6CZJ8_PRIPA|nr:hypothetical protein PRIPAC_70488 [Pristionchus pacificus]|eukprot:PDM83654.1 hypothetical protein PRIPAC_30141 [Pristionchus pacificus]
MVDIFIDYNREQYSPGDTVTAQISIHVLRSPKKICSIRISVIGWAHVKWEETHSSGKTNTTKRYSSTHTYVSRSDYLLSPPVNDRTMYLSVGMHTYLYKFILPDSCDSSYSRGYGKIRYECRVEIVRSFFRCNIRTMKRFDVYRPVDLLALWRSPSPVTQTLETRFLPFQKGSITLKGIIYDAGYLPGQTIYLEASMYNRSPRTITSIEIYLVEATTYIAFYGTRAYQRIIKNRLRNLGQTLQIASGSDYFYSREIAIPKFIPLHTTCPYIKVNYYLKLKISTSTVLGTSVAVKIPVVIGTNPTNHVNPPRIPNIPHNQPIERRESEESDTTFYSFSDVSNDAPDFSKYNDRSNLLR